MWITNHHFIHLKYISFLLDENNEIIKVGPKPTTGVLTRRDTWMCTHRHTHTHPVKKGRDHQGDALTPMITQNHQKPGESRGTDSSSLPSRFPSQSCINLFKTELSLLLPCPPSLAWITPIHSSRFGCVCTSSKKLPNAHSQSEVAFSPASQSPGYISKTAVSILYHSLFMCPSPQTFARCMHGVLNKGMWNQAFIEPTITLRMLEQLHHKGPFIPYQAILNKEV